MIRTSTDDCVTTIALARGEKRNALTPEMLDELARAVRVATDAALRGETRAVLLRGEGDVFCAGFDLSLCRDDDSVLERLLRGLSSCVGMLLGVSCPVVACARGAAIAGGCALLGGCDVVVTDTGARLGYPVVTLGVSPGVSAPTLTRLVGIGASRRLLLEPRLIDGREALRLGLAHECLESGEACSRRAGEIARELARKPAHALAATKAWLSEIGGSTRSDLDAGLRASLALVNSEEQRELLPRAWSRGA
jgi:enoyl-CoA hydratase/carnithine racemase